MIPALKKVLPRSRWSDPEAVNLSLREIFAPVKNASSNEGITYEGTFLRFFAEPGYPWPAPVAHLDCRYSGSCSWVHRSLDVRLADRYHRCERCPEHCGPAGQATWTKLSFAGEVGQARIESPSIRAWPVPCKFAQSLP